MPLRLASEPSLGCSCCQRRAHSGFSILSVGAGAPRRGDRCQQTNRSSHLLPRPSSTPTRRRRSRVAGRHVCAQYEYGPGPTSGREPMTRVSCATPGGSALDQGGGSLRTGACSARTRGRGHQSVVRDGNHASCNCTGQVRETATRQTAARFYPGLLDTANAARPQLPGERGYAPPT